MKLIQKFSILTLHIFSHIFPKIKIQLMSDISCKTYPFENYISIVIANGPLRNGMKSEKKRKNERERERERERVRSSSRDVTNRTTV